MIETQLHQIWQKATRDLDFVFLLDWSFLELLFRLPFLAYKHVIVVVIDDDDDDELLATNPRLFLLAVEEIVIVVNPETKPIVA